MLLPTGYPGSDSLTNAISFAIPGERERDFVSGMKYQKNINAAIAIAAMVKKLALSPYEFA